MVTVTHDIDEAITMADRVLVMSQNPGRIVSELKVDLPWPRRHMDVGFQHLRDELMHQFKGTDTGMSGREENRSKTKTESKANSAA